MENLEKCKELVVEQGIKSYSQSDRWLEELKEKSAIENPNYISVLKRIPSYFKVSDFYKCMMLAFKFGESRGRECEKDLIKNNASATFSVMKLYHQVNGCLPKTEKEMWKWEKEFLCTLEMEENHHEQSYAI